MAGDTVVGFIDVFDTRPRDFAEFVDFMKSVGQMVAGVIENAQLLADLERNNQQLTMLVESGLEFGATLELDMVLTSIADRMCAVTGADCCDVYALEEETLRGLVNVDQGVADADFAGTTYRLADLALATQACESRAPVRMLRLHHRPAPHRVRAPRVAALGLPRQSAPAAHPPRRGGGHGQHLRSPAA